MPRAYCLKHTGPESVASYPLIAPAIYPATGHRQPATGNRPAIAESGPLTVATGNRTGGAQRVDIARAARPVGRG